MSGHIRGIGCGRGPRVDCRGSAISLPWTGLVGSHTFREQAVLPALGVLPQKPAVAKVIVALDQLNAVASPQAQLVGAAGGELVCAGVSGAVAVGVAVAADVGVAVAVAIAIAIAVAVAVAVALQCVAIVRAAQQAALEGRGPQRGRGDSRTTTSRSPGRQCSVWERSPEIIAMVAAGGCGRKPRAG